VTGPKSVTTRTGFLAPSEIFAEEPAPFDDDYARRCFRVLRMVAILHGKGFHGLRVFPYEYPLAYRIELYPVSYAEPDGVKYSYDRFGEELQRKHLIARHSGANNAHYFGWEDAEKLSAHRLALLFLERFPDLARASYGLDFAYAGWYATLLAHCEYGYLPYLFAEYEPEMDVLRLRHVGRKTTQHLMDWFPLPPSPSGGITLDPRPAPRWMEPR